jgi:hypothetical protein
LLDRFCLAEQFLLLLDVLSKVALALKLFVVAVSVADWAQTVFVLS